MIKNCSPPIKIVLPFVPKTINYYIGRNNKWDYLKEKKKIHNYCRLMTIKEKKGISKCKMVITFYFKDKRKRDVLNYDKMLMDGLVEAGIIKDDNYEVVTEVTLKGGVDKENPRTEIEIEEL